MLYRVARTAPAVISHTWLAGETPVDPSAALFEVHDPSGATVQSGPATIPPDTGTTTFDLTPVADLTALTVLWTATIGADDVEALDFVEIVSGHMFSLAEARKSDSALADPVRYTTADLERVRVDVETECEDICDRAWVPLYARVTLDGGGGTSVLLTHPGIDRSAADVRVVRSVAVAPRAGAPFVALTATQLAAVVATADGQLVRVDGNVWPAGRANVLVEYEYGRDSAPPTLKTAALLRLRSRLNLFRSSIPDRAISWTAPEGGTYRIDLPDTWKVGIPEIDAVYSRYSRRAGTGTGADDGRQVAASRTLTYEPQVNSLFHWRRR